MSVNVGTLKASELMDGYLSTVPTGWCRLCMHRENSASLIETGNKYPTTQVDRPKTDHGKKTSEGNQWFPFLSKHRRNEHFFHGAGNAILGYRKIS
ncbi:hypothetical protein AVEN_72984-1 [Araneus ventricosus]|uniref:Uncharacterized protein n=1 Tax=Araneus ventricosus TaxID=182803 RepID=A0A4Y2SUJ4_ARAVE|nr:hypothetical protein AVEN_72984-1 [Araneus ventricosus]